ncbi:MAG: LemA protein [Gammaproteobacteria bacterium]|jgi:LemA protein
MAGNAFWIIVVLAVGAVIWGISIYNGLVKRKNYVEDAWSGIEVQLKKRHNLVPNLVKTIKAYAEHESGLLESVTKLRAPNISSSVSKIGGEEQAFGQALQGLMVQVEAYPDIKADGNFKNLQNQLSEIEGDIESARRYYNGAVRDYNTLIQSFPSNMIATRYDFDEAEFFELDVETARQAPEIDFS